MAIPKVMGTEIEYGITVKNDRDFDPISSCVLLVNAYREDSTARILWDYDQENPLADARGFQVDGEKYTPNQQENIARNKTLVNGARYYVDHAHPEYSCPEVTNARELVIHEKAGERIVEQSRRDANALLPPGTQMLIYKNNSDRKGNSYGCHENYLMDRRTSFKQIVEHLMPFFVTRQVYSGAGKVGTREPRPPLRLPARAARGLLRDRSRARHDGQAADHQHARRAARRPREVPPPARDRRRLEHERVHDLPAQRRDRAGALDDRGRRDRPGRRAARPGARRSRKSRTIRPAGRTIETASGRRRNAVQLQMEYLEMAQRYATARDLSGDGQGPDLGVGTRARRARSAIRWSSPTDIDWVIKKALIESFMERKGIDWGAPQVQMLDLQYHDLRPEKGLYYLLERQGRGASAS